MSKLVCTHGLNKGDEFPVHEGTNTIGRANDSRVVLFDKKCSRKHAQIIKKGHHYSVEDLESRNGTYLNGKKLKSHTNKTIRMSDRIRIGRTVLVLSEQAIGGITDQAATDAAADLQSKKFGSLVSDAAVQASHTHDQPAKRGIRQWLKSLFKK